MKILLIDDSAIIRRVLKNVLRDVLSELDVLEASDGVEGLRVLKENKDVAIVFLDFNMPNMTGDICLEHIRKNSELNKVKVIMATTEAEKKTVLKMMKLGANGYLVKPFNPESIIKALRPIVERMGTSI